MGISDEDIKRIYTNVFIGQGKHGDFLRSFAGAVMRADRKNFEVLIQPALHFISKYNLESYK